MEAVNIYVALLIYIIGAFTGHFLAFANENLSVDMATMGPSLLWLTSARPRLLGQRERRAPP